MNKAAKCLDISKQPAGDRYLSSESQLALARLAISLVARHVDVLHDLAPVLGHPVVRVAKRVFLVLGRLVLDLRRNLGAKRVKNYFLHTGSTECFRLRMILLFVGNLILQGTNSESNAVRSRGFTGLMKLSLFLFFS